MSELRKCDQCKSLSDSSPVRFTAITLYGPTVREYLKNTQDSYQIGLELHLCPDCTRLFFESLKGPLPTQSIGSRQVNEIAVKPKYWLFDRIWKYFKG